MKRFLFLNDARQLLAFSIHRNGTNLPDIRLSRGDLSMITAIST